MPANGRFGGHIVAGHVDATGQIAGRKKDDNAIWIRVEAPPEVLRYVVEKGSITIDGISLTVAAVSAHDFFGVDDPAYGGGDNAWKQKKEGDIVNLETDIIGKYVEKLLHPQEEKKKATSPGNFWKTVDSKTPWI